MGTREVWVRAWFDRGADGVIWFGRGFGLVVVRGGMVWGLWGGAFDGLVF